MKRAQEFSSNATTFFTHFVGLALAGKPYIVQRFKSMLDGDIRSVEAETPKSGHRPRVKRVLVTLKIET